MALVHLKLRKLAAESREHVSSALFSVLSVKEVTSRYHSSHVEYRTSSLEIDRAYLIAAMPFALFLLC